MWTVHSVLGSIPLRSWGAKGHGGENKGSWEEKVDTMFASVHLKGSLAKEKSSVVFFILEGRTRNRATCNTGQISAKKSSQLRTF